MAFHNPRGRANYEPNSWGPEIGGPRESQTHGFQTFPEEPAGPKVRMRPESFADHYSQARQFYISQDHVEQRHIQEALVFELSKCEVPAIRIRMVAHLINIDRTLAQSVADGLGLPSLPVAAKPAVSTRTDLPPSDALSMLKNPADTFKGRKLGVLITDAVDAKLLKALQDAVAAEGATLETIAPTIGGVAASDGSHIPAQHQIDGGPSVVFDAVAILASEKGVQALLKSPPARDFAADAYAHYKFVGFTPPAAKLFTKIGLPADLDDGFHSLAKPGDVKTFIAACKRLRFWDRTDAA